MATILDPPSWISRFSPKLQEVPKVNEKQSNTRELKHKIYCNKSNEDIPFSGYVRMTMFDL